MINGIHIEIVWIAGIVLGVLYSKDYCPYDEVDKNELLFCIYIFGIKISWW